MLDIDKMVVCITGAASGIGLEIAKTFAENGAKVFITDLNEELVQNQTLSLNNRGFEVTGLKCDVSSEEDIKRTINNVHQQYGRLDLLINNAGFQHVSPLEDFPTEKFELLLKVMITGAFLGIKHAFPLMKQQNFGRIINIASINGLVGFAGKAGYNSAKHGVIGLTKVAALEGATFGITVNSLCPGYVDTPLVQNQLTELATTRNVPVEKVLEEVIFPLVPQKKLIEPKEIADYALFLASDMGKSITGQAVVIDGGYTAQ